VKRYLFLLLLLLNLLNCFAQHKNADDGIINENHLVLDELLASMVNITGGTFIMGQKNKRPDGWGKDAMPAHKVTLSGFKLNKFEITQEQWWTVMGISQNDEYCKKCPIEAVSWNDVNDFLGKLNSETGRRFRLPTEAEWEYAASGGNKSRGYIFSGSNDLITVANNAIARGILRSIPVGSKKPNELGLYDMSGNVWEWCSDWFGENYYSVSALNNPKGPISGEQRVLRGGSWASSEMHHRVKIRSSGYPDDRGIRFGFRIAED
jgi:formylglycine-generating enzyme required for sulfatase activity